MDNRSRELPHRCDAVRVCQLHLQLTILSLATGNLQSNGSFRSEVRDQLDHFVCERLHPQPTNRKCSDNLLILQHRDDEVGSKAYGLEGVFWSRVAAKQSLICL